ncbi:sulfurtransferase [Psychrobium sp. nBUS_13]|uniref:sulfurtransferase n=1 Tax=Psychrobium sp. nBUS_13 TaxID=3395319 RepID=UPI003EC0FFA3
MNNLPLVNGDWVATQLANDKIKLVDASMKKIVGKEPIVYELPILLPQSLPLNIETALSDSASLLSNTMPSVKQFSDYMMELGITNDDVVVIYDNQGMYSAPRAWWLFKVMGHKNVYVLDGGLPKWQLEKQPVVASYQALGEKSHYITQLQHEWMANQSLVVANLKNGEYTLIDARGAVRFHGQSLEPRPNVRPGHIPNSLNLPFAKVLNGDRFKSVQALKKEFAELGIEDVDHPMIFSCGSGITACILLLAAHIAGFNNLRLYDGSWAQWGSDESLPVSL